MDDHELRALVREVVARHVGSARGPAAVESTAARLHAMAAHGPADPGFGSHASHVLYGRLLNPGDACLIEPAVECVHCGFCKSHGY